MDYGNARIAALRSRLLDEEAVRRLAASESPAALLVALERIDDWRPLVRELGPLVTSPRAAAELVIERHRTACLAPLPAFYPHPARDLVEALVLPLDLDRAIEVLRRRHGGEPGDVVSASVTRGALLDGSRIALLARAAPVEAVRALASLGLLTRRAAATLARRYDRDGSWPELEAGLREAWEDARAARASVDGASAADRSVLFAILAEDRAAARLVGAELRAAGPAAAAALERASTLRRLGRLAGRGHRDPLGIGAVAGYVAAVELQAIRLRAALAAVAGQWSRDHAGAWLSTGVA
jgi:hypothetical protein